MNKIDTLNEYATAITNRHLSQMKPEHAVLVERLRRAALAVKESWFSSSEPEPHPHGPDGRFVQAVVMEPSRHRGPASPSVPRRF